MPSFILHLPSGFLKNLIEINESYLRSNFRETDFAKLYLVFSPADGSYFKRFWGTFSGSVNAGDPLVVFILASALLGASAVRNGIEVIARCSIIIGPWLS